MRAAVLEEFKQPVQLRTDVAKPEPGPREVVVRTRAAGICRTDLKVVDGIIPTVETPRVLGHEVAGEVAAVGAEVDSFSEGDRVTVSLDVTCGVCAYCRVGEFDHCARLRRLGLEWDGGLADFVRVPAENLVPIADSVSFPEAAVIPDAVGSPYHAVVTRANVRPAQTVAVYGLGGLGLVAVQVGRLLGARVIGIARTPERRKLAEELGATWSIDPRDGAVSEQIRERTDGLGVHAFFDFVGIEGSVEQAVLASRKGGKVVVVGYVVPEVVAPTMRMVYDEVAIMGSRGSTRRDLHEATELVGQGQIRPIIGRELELDQINEGLDLLREGSVVGRAVFRFD